MRYKSLPASELAENMGSRLTDTLGRRYAVSVTKGRPSVAHRLHSSRGLHPRQHAPCPSPLPIERTFGDGSRRAQGARRDQSQHPLPIPRRGRDSVRPWRCFRGWQEPLNSVVRWGGRRPWMHSPSCLPLRLRAALASCSASGPHAGPPPWTPSRHSATNRRPK